MHEEHDSTWRRESGSGSMLGRPMPTPDERGIGARNIIVLTLEDVGFEWTDMEEQGAAGTPDQRKHSGLGGWFHPEHAPEGTNLAGAIVNVCAALKDTEAALAQAKDGSDLWPVGPQVSGYVFVDAAARDENGWLRITRRMPRSHPPESYDGPDSQFAFAARIIRSLARRTDEDALIALRELRNLITHEERACGQRLADQGYSYADLGRFSDITRQAARQRYQTPTIPARK